MIHSLKLMTKSGPRKKRKIKMMMRRRERIEDDATFNIKPLNVQD